MKIKIFFDSSVIISAIISTEGASRKILTMCEAAILDGIISGKVVEEVNRVAKIKFPGIQMNLDEILKKAKLKIINKIPPEILSKAKSWISDSDDAPILAAAKSAEVDVLLTLDIRHFIRDLNVTKKSGLKIMTPGEFLQGFWKIV